MSVVYCETGELIFSARCVFFLDIKNIREETSIRIRIRVVFFVSRVMKNGGLFP